MTASQLIERLKGLPSDCKVMILSDYGWQYEEMSDEITVDIERREIVVS